MREPTCNPSLQTVATLSRCLRCFRRPRFPPGVRVRRSGPAHSFAPPRFAVQATLVGDRSLARVARGRSGTGASGTVGDDRCFFTLSLFAGVIAMSDSNRLNRRHVLRGAAAGMASFGATGLVTAEGDADRPWADVPTETLGDVHFAELGIEFDVDLPTNRPGCPGTPYFVDRADGTLLLAVVDDEVRTIVGSSGGMVRHKGFDPLPTRINRPDLEYLPASSNARLATLASVPVDEPVRIPAIRCETTSDGALSVAVGGRSSEISPESTGEVELDPVPVRAAEGHGPPPKVTRDGVVRRERTANQGAPVDATPKVVANNFGELTVEAVDHSEVEA